MCGIAGVISRNKDFFFKGNELLEMSKRLFHRGPDDAGLLVSHDLKRFQCFATELTPTEVKISDLDWCPNEVFSDLESNYNFGVLHQRLSIIDLSAAGHQPMRYKDTWISYNGEIYNYLELREELTQLGYHFLTETDTEVVLKAHDCWGKSFLQRLNGMFAFMIFNEKSGTCFFARDRIGVKPFYFINHGDYFAFASEIKALHYLSFVDTKINRKHLYSYFANHEVEFDGNTLFDPIQELLPGHFLEFTIGNDSQTTSSYFNLQKVEEKKTQHYSDVVAHTKSLLNDALRIRLRSDVPVGFCLSGGIDSSSLVSLAATSNHDLRTFSALTMDEKTDEKVWIDYVLEKHQVKGFSVACNADDLIRYLEEIIYFQDIPILTASTFAQDQVMRLAKQNGVKVLIDGQGGDELFAGYIPFYTAQLHEYLIRFKWLKLFRFLKNLKNAPYTRGDLMKTYVKTLLNKYVSKKILFPLLRKKRIDLNYFNGPYDLDFQSEIDYSRGYFLDKPNVVLKKYYQGNFLKNLLRWEDRCSMHHSIESRTPFSDDLPLMEFLFSVPFEEKLNHGVSKSILRQAMEGVLPDEIKDRKDKKGFSIPQSNWILEKETYFKEIIETYQDPINFIHKTKVLSDWNHFIKNDKFQNFIFKYACYLIWVKRYHLTV